MQNHLNVKQRAIIPIAAFTANGDLDKLRVALCDGLDAGLTVSEIKEILVQLYAYAGFPRSLNGIGTFMTLLSEREKEGIRDEKGRGSSPLPTSRTSLEFGAENQTRLVGQPVTGPVFDFAPAIDQFLKAHLFGDIFQRDVLNWQDRELATVAALANIEGVNPQLQGHLSIALHNGLSPEQLRDLIGVLRTKCGPTVAENAGVVFDQVLASSKQVPFGDRPAMDNVEATANLQKEKNMGQQHSDLRNGGIFPVGEKNEKYAKYFTGTSYLKVLSTERMFIGNVTFEPGCRNFWHIHHKGGQILLVTGGRGWYQEWGKAAKELRAGDVVNIAPETKHWHGAAKDSWFSHVAVEVPAEGGSTEWLEPVPDEAYNRLPK
ncbi:carboxymuconolactone decarboxylase family protein [Geomonas sp. Red259]|uniref:Carboxymuconolactone decarboxylase family protein n=2 Tax=Geomonas propionica TaxID=2798582 RepID=A0ABS0YS85_9BACT|nr:carboxymuconolactone decarboxylase family protein [Geomonas propionica]